MHFPRVRGPVLWRVALKSSLQSGFDGDELLSRPGITLITVDADVIHQAERLIESCEHCHRDDAEIPFDWLLADVTGKRGAYEFVLSEPAHCPNCKQPITEKTLVEWDGGVEVNV